MKLPNGSFKCLPWKALFSVGVIFAMGGHAWAQSPAVPAAPAPATAPTGSMSGFMEKLRLKVEQLTPQKQMNASTAVGGVRGSAVAASDVYWKGETKPQTIDAAELEAFQKGVALIETQGDKGNGAKAREVFTAFLKTYPESMLKPDAEEILQRLAAEPVAQ